VQDGNECVAEEGTGGKTDADAGAGGTTGSGGSKSSGGSSGSGGSVASGGKVVEPDGGGGEPVDDGLKFTGATSAAPANQTPPTGSAKPDAVRVSWEPATYETQPTASIHYEIFWAEESGEQNFAAPQEVAPPGSTSFTLQGLAPSSTYHIVVRAVSDKGASRDTNTVEVTGTPAFDDEPPTFAGAAAAAPAGPTSVKVSWKAATDDQTPTEGVVYRVYWTDVIDKNLRLGAVSAPGATSAVVTGLTAPKTDYYFRVQALDAAGNVESNNVNVRGATGGDVKPPIFAGCIAATEPSAATAIVSWIPAIDDTTPQDKISYTVYASDVPIDRDTDFKALQVVGKFTGVTRGQVTGLTPATRYRFVCRASDASTNEDDNFIIQTAITGSDGEAPTFAGLTKAEVSDSGIMLSWGQATDNQTADRDIAYRVYAAITAGGQDPTTPVVTSPPGVTTLLVQKSQLLTLVDKTSNQDFYFIVRAADGAGNVDDNAVEVKVHTLTSFADDVQPIFTSTCAVSACHTAADPGVPAPQGQILDKGAAYANVVGVIAREGVAIAQPTIQRVNTNKVLMDSYLYRKITGSMPLNGSAMPPSGAIKELTDDERQIIIAWISEGAPNN
jgi:cytochrome c5